MHQKAKSWAISLHVSLGQFLGNGDYGEAYQADDDKVIKITQDEAEYLLATEMVGYETDHVVTIYETIDFEDGFFGVFQEKLEMDPEIESYYEELICESNAQGVGIIDIDTDDMSQSPSWKAMQLLDAILTGSQDIMSITSMIPMDIHYTNIGLRPDTKQFVLFDQRGEYD